MEQWRIIRDFSNYEISNKARVRNLKTGRILKTTIDHRGYESVCLCKNGRQYTKWVHRLVAEAFIELKDSEDVVHIDENHSNNNPENLIGRTRSENIRDKYSNGRRQRHKMKKVLCVETGEIFESIVECAKVKGTSRQAVSRCINNQKLANKDGYHFKSI